MPRRTPAADDEGIAASGSAGRTRRLAAEVDDVGTRGLVYLVSARRADAGWIHYRTCDLREAAAMARRLGSTVTVERPAR